MFNLKDKKVLITGATGGIGSALTKKFANAGSFVVVSARNEEKLNELKKDVGGEKNCAIFPKDLGDLTQIEGFIADVDEKVGGIDIVVNNAGITKDMLSMRMKVSDFEEVLKINLTSAFVFSRDAAVKMLRRKWGRIINMSSIVATLGNMGQANYVASKAAMIGMTKTLAQEFATKGITINCIAPGFIKTPMTDVLTDEVKNTMLSKIPQGKFGEPDDIANTALFLASEEASYITGQTIHVNGGMLMV